jgi:hypothetical protein
VALATSANPGDVIVLDVGVTYTGNLTVPQKSNPSNKWTYVMGTGYAGPPAPEHK